MMPMTVNSVTGQSAQVDFAESSSMFTRDQILEMKGVFDEILQKMDAKVLTEKRAEFTVYLTLLSRQWSQVQRIWTEIGQTELYHSGIGEEGYPFKESFDELEAEVAEWARVQAAEFGGASSQGDEWRKRAHEFWSGVDERANRGVENSHPGMKEDR